MKLVKKRGNEVGFFYISHAHTGPTT